ncbi:MAG: hypothetical protein JAY85_12650 [Candidatus Thiodiazotropha weberae]|uniref:Yip1 domain-containing protein n=1 Tax=Candidatus Thiodiazotropha endoloripes TaxID=1818881 RepID=A0A1E2UM87_9GAMM|nr:hypothetical protein [Candidatus Thiodiazotropha endoloripes]MCG7899290.1 hypothetical protein [Candidatus Thiodiazotropha weberae]MCG7904644.1 hypothetical protein [Candidatus Thiodiazotropha weberae]MCG7914141.1 hypothetical protein [Candidatus Thiodiazotropha weberae]ODB84178.1 hypothetical protein A3193_15255 [Candidatus Thiodiazotropha endoloripes]ODB91454.1 hypothetical protein A3195_08645 [Candidatus Thiodiazotropha endoloripes]
MLQLLHLPLFIPTFIAVLIRPLRFFRDYHQLVISRDTSFWDINAERDDDPYLSPVKFSALAILLSNLIFPLILQLGVMVGAVTPHYAAFAEWAEKEGHLDPFSPTGIGIADDLIREVIVLAMFYALGHLIALFSAKRIPARFAAGYYFYWSAWGLLGSLVSFGLILISLIVPLYQTGLPLILDSLINIASLLMFFLFPIFFWPRFIEISRPRCAVALAGGLIVWIALIAVLAPMIVDIPDFGMSH